MSIVLSLFVQLLHIGLMLVAAPTIAGVADRLDANLAGQPGPPVLQPWLDLMRLSRKTPMRGENVSAASQLAPALALGTTLAAAALVPSFSLGMALSPLADMLVLVGLLTAARTVIALAALDAGIPRPALAAQQASALAVLAEPALMLAVIALALMGGSFNLGSVIAQQREGMLLPAAASAVALTALLALLLADTSLPDRPTDQIFAGSDLAMVRVATWLRRLVWIDLIGGLFLPIGMASADDGPLAWVIGLACWGIKLAAAVLALSGFRALLGRVPPRALPDLAGVAALLALLAVVIVLSSAVPP